MSPQIVPRVILYIYQKLLDNSGRLGLINLRRFFAKSVGRSVGAGGGEGGSSRRKGTSSPWTDAPVSSSERKYFRPLFLKQVWVARPVRSEREKGRGVCVSLRFQTEAVIPVTWIDCNMTLITTTIYPSGQLSLCFILLLRTQAGRTHLVMGRVQL